MNETVSVYKLFAVQASNDECVVECGGVLVGCQNGGQF